MARVSQCVFVSQKDFATKPWYETDRLRDHAWLALNKDHLSFRAMVRLYGYREKVQADILEIYEESLIERFFKNWKGMN